MIFGEVVYALFLLLTVLCYWLFPARARVMLIAVSGLLFYAYYAGWAVLLLLALAVGSWLTLYAPWAQERVAVGEVLPAEGRANRSSLATTWMLIFIGVLIYFKYAGFLSASVGGPAFQSIAPLAISFFTFEFIHMAFERRRGNIRSASFQEYLAFIFFFPTMIAGPIKRFGQFDEQLREARPSSPHFLEGLFRIVIGLFKKMVLADNLNTLIQEIGSPAKSHNLMMLSGAVFLYGFRIYFDFSGYSDIAIGSARLFGIRVPENFLNPYLQTNISAFWRSWHRSLYSWLIDYVFIPLGGSRVGFGRGLLNIMIVMAISGLWHGAAWNFVLWGLWHGSMLVVHKVWLERVKPLCRLAWVEGRVAVVVSYLLTMAGVWFGWLLFMWPLHEVAAFLTLFRK